MFIQSRIVSSESHNIRTSSLSSHKRTLRWIGHSRSFKVIFIGVNRNPERIVVIMYNNVDIISETYEDIATENCKLVDFNHHTPVWWQYAKKRFRLSRNNLYCHRLESLTTFLSLIIWVYVCYFSRSYFWKSNAHSHRSAGRKQTLRWIATQGHPRSFPVATHVNVSQARIS